MKTLNEEVRAKALKVIEEVFDQRFYTRDDLALILGEVANEIEEAIDMAKIPFDQWLKDRCRRIIETAFVKNIGE